MDPDSIPTAEGSTRGILYREPLIPFAVIGGLLFVIYGIARPTPVEVIEVSPQTVQALEQFEESLTGQEVNEEQSAELIESFVEDEVLMREALRQGLERKDSRIRKRLLSIMRATLDEPVSEPTRNELQAYYRENADRFADREVIFFDDVYFGFGSDEAAEQNVLRDLRDGADPKQLGDSFWSSTNRRPMSRGDLQPAYGREFVDQLYQLDPGEWNGPFLSSQGTHFVRVNAKKILPAPTFDELHEFLEQDWMFQRRREIQQQKIAELRKRYKVVLVEE